MVLLALALFLLIRAHGEELSAPPPLPATNAAAPGTPVNLVVQLLVALTAVIVTGQLLGRLFAWIGQPPVIGEVVAGILLGPSLLGTDVSARVLPSTVAPVLGATAQLGVILYMFVVGLHLDAGRLRARVASAVAISHASILAPFLLGAALALPLYPRLSSSDVPFTNFALFMGIAMSVTAFPVLARILADRGLTATPLGMLAIGCAAVDDVTAWCLLALVTGIVQTRFGAGVQVAIAAAAYVAVMWLAVRPLLKRLAADWDGEERGTAALVVVLLLCSALATEAIGIHAVFGAFLVGALVPHDSAMARIFTAQLEQVVTILFLPAFFAFTGMRTRIDLLTTSTEWLLCAAVTVVATAGKFGGTVAAARLTGIGWRQAAALGTLMNTRGLMELIVLNIGLDLRVISPSLFAMLVVMALVTTLATSPLLAVLERDGGAA
jgi:Kef-type K+ transport system membrane component KefB